MGNDESKEDAQQSMSPEQVRMRKLVTEATKLPGVILEGAPENGKSSLKMIALACYSPGGLVYVTYGFRGVTREETNSSLRTKITALDDQGITEEMHRLIMQKAREYGSSGKEVLAGLTFGEQAQGRHLTVLHFPKEFNLKEASRVIKQAALSKRG